MSVTHPAQVTVTTNGVTRTLADDLDTLTPTAATVTPAAPGAVARTVAAKLSDVTSINDFGIGDPTATINILENGRVSQLPYIDPFARFRMDTFTGAWAVAALLGEKQEATGFTRTTVGELIVGGAATSAAAAMLRFQDNPQGLLIEPSRINQIGAPDAPVAETISLGVSSYYLHIEGSGSLTVTLATGTATGLPLTVTASTPATFAITGAATVNTTVTGSVTFAQLETGKLPTSRVHTHSPSRGSDQLLAAGLLRNAKDWIVTIRAQPNGGLPWGPGDDRGLFTIGENFTTANSATAYVTGGNGGIQFQVSDSANAIRSIGAITFLGTVEHDFWFYGSSDGQIEAWVDGERVVGAPSGAGTGIISTMPANLRAGTAFNASYLNGVVKDFRLYYDTTPARLPKPQWTRSITANTVACIGDSITFGTGATTPYPTTLQATLSAGSIGAWTVLNAGVFGDHAYESIRRWGGGIRRQTHKYVVLFVGTNDISIGLTAATVWTYLQRIATQVRTDGKTLALVTILPRNSFAAGQTAERVKLNNTIKAYCAAGNAILVDADPDFDNGDGHTLKVAYDSGDGTHPNQAGADHIAALVAAAIPH